MTATERLALGALELEVRRAGPAPGAAPTLVLLHEGLGCAGMWRDFPERLAERTGWAVVAYSRPGYGRSSPCALPRPLDYMHREAVDVLPGLLDAAGVERCVLFGHSDGASIATIHAGTVRDQRVRGLVLMAPHFFTESEGLAAIARAREAWRHGDLRERLARHHQDNVECAFRGWNDAWLDPEFATWDLRPELRAVRVPMLVVQGEDDEYGTLAQVETARSGSGGPVDAVVLTRCGHAPHRDRAEMTLALAAGFVATVEAPPWECAEPGGRR